MIGTEYMGLELKSPVIVSSGPLTQNIVSLKKAEEAGAGAVVLKSIFEEQIEADVSSELEGNAEYLAHSSAEEFFASSSRDYYIDRYMKLLSEAKKELSIPVIASVSAKDRELFAPCPPHAQANAAVKHKTPDSKSKTTEFFFSFFFIFPPVILSFHSPDNQIAHNFIFQENKQNYDGYHRQKYRRQLHGDLRHVRVRTAFETP